MAPPQCPCILRANLIKAKSSVPAVNCYLWGWFFFCFFFLKLLATFKSTLTLEIEHNTLMNSHLWQILCKQPVNWICDQVFPYQGHMVGASVLYPCLSCRLSFTPSAITESNAFQWKNYDFFFSVTWKGSWLPVAFSLINGHATVVDSWGRMDWKEGLWAVINLLLDYAG